MLRVLRRTALVIIGAALLGVGISRLQAVTHKLPLATASPKVTPFTSPISLPTGSTWLISTVHFTSAEDGWVIAASSADRGPRTILHTTDGGQHWTAMLSWTGNYTIGRNGLQDISMQFVDSQHGFVLDPQSGQGQGSLFRTTDGGRTWQILTLPGAPAPGSALSFVDAIHGWLLADVEAAMSQSSATVYATSDGGRHWAAVVHVDYGGTSHGLSSGGDKDDLVFRNASVGWITAFSATGPIIYVTQDGGRNWQLQTSLPNELSPGFEASANASTTPYPPEFFNQKIGVFPFDIQGQQTPDALYVSITTDGGMHWSAARRLPATATDTGPLYWQFLDATNWWIGAGTKLWTTSDAGATWSTTILPLSNGSQPLSLDFAGPETGYAVIGTGIGSGRLLSGTILLKTADRGVDWSPVTLSGLGQAAASDICGDWSSSTSSTGAAIAHRYGEIRTCLPLDASRSTWVITTLGLATTNATLGQNGGVLLYDCTTTACQDGASDYPLAGWHYFPAPYCCGVTLLGTPSPTILLVDNGGHQLMFDTVTATYSS